MFPRIICRVKALYPYVSNDPSSLSFDKGDHIDVLAQLDSGWWDGWCSGSRGWFPSNYVQVVEVFADPPEDQEPATLPSPSNTSPRTPLFNSTVPSPRKPTTPPIHPLLPSSTSPSSKAHFGWTGSVDTTAPVINAGLRLPTGWSEQLTEDGKTHFYYNHRTGKIQYEHPGSTHSDSEYDSHDEDSFGLHRNGSVDSSVDEEQVYRSYPTLQQQQHPQHPYPHQYRRHLSIDSLPANVDIPEPPVSNLPNHWVERVTPQGRTYYCNLVTQETTWDINAIDKRTGRLLETRDDDSDVEGHLDPSTQPTQAPNEPQEKREKKPEGPLTWQKLSSDIASAIQQLNLSAQQGDRHAFATHTASIVSSIRLLMYASRSLDKEAGHMQDRVLRDPHRAVMAALSKLILSVKMSTETSNATIQNESIYRVQRDAGDVLVAVRAFVTTCQQLQVPVQEVGPTLFLESVRTSFEDLSGDKVHTERETGNKRASLTGVTPVQKARYPLNQDLLVSLETHTNQIFGTTEALSKATVFILTLQREHADEDDDRLGSIRDDSKARSDVVVLFRRFSMQVGQYLSILEDIDLSNVDGTQIPSLAEAQSHKQRLYNAVGSLFVAIQGMTNENATVDDCVSNIEHAIKQVEEAINDVSLSIEVMVEQRRVWLSKVGSVDGEPPKSPTATTMNRGENGVEPVTAEGYPYPNHAPYLLTGSNMATKALAPAGGFGNDRARARQPSVRPQEGRTEQSDLWFLGDDYEEGEIAFGADGNVKGGTLPALVARLTPHDTLDSNFISTFLLTYRSFCTTEEFIHQLEMRYNLRAPEGLTPEELEIWTERKQKLVRFRMFNVIKSWLENYYNEEDAFILSRLEFFTNTVIRDSSSFSADQLNRLIRKRREQDAEGGLKKLVPNSTSAPLPILPRDLHRFTLLDIDPLELSRQLTLMDFKLYSKIRPIECFSKAWSVEDKEGASTSNVKRSIDYCNSLTCWVTETILANDEAKKRATVIKYWAQVAARCRSCCNFNTCMAIISAFDNSAIGRLRKTWELVGNKTNGTLNDIRKLMGAHRNFQEYREMVHSVNPPCIPFLGIYLQDLTFIEDGNPDFLKKSSNLINFAKRQKAAEVIREINQFQSPSYPFQSVPEIQDFITAQLGNHHDVEAMYKRSLLLEPREQQTA